MHILTHGGPVSQYMHPRVHILTHRGPVSQYNGMATETSTSYSQRPAASIDELSAVAQAIQNR